MTAGHGGESTADRRPRGIASAGLRAGDEGLRREVESLR